MINYTLHKLSEGFVLYKEEIIPFNPNGGTNGSFICLCELEYNDDTKWVSNVGNCQGCRELLSSSFHINKFPNLPKIDFSALSEEEQKEIGWFDVNKLVKKEAPLSGNIYLSGYKDGFQKAQELLYDKRFTLEDIMSAYEEGERKIEQMNQNSISYKTFDELIESISQKSWKVELEMDVFNVTGNLTALSTIRPKITNNKVKVLKLL